MTMGDTDLVPYDAGTFGSRSTPQMGNQLRKAAATARDALIDLAAKKWNTTAKNLQVENGMIVNTATKEKTGYGELTKGKQLLMAISDNVTVIAAKDWKVAGTSVPKIDQKDFISGKHKYVSDMKLPGMFYGKVLRPPSYGAKLINADLSKAKNIPGVIVVKDGDFVGVAASDTRTATSALLSIDAKWEELKDHPSNANIFDYLLQNTSQEKGGRNESTTTGDADSGLSAAAFKYSNTYNINYIAHVPLEPRAAAAQWTDGKLTVWTGTQRPFGVQEELADTFRLSKEKVRVIMPDTGSGYGGKHSGEAAIEAARLAQEAKAPVKVVWTREEEFTWAYFRPGGVIKVDAGVNKDGTITAWKFTNYNSGGAGLDTQYKVGNKAIAYVPSNTPLKQGSYRGLAATANVFARECSMTDLARLAGMDPLDFRLKNLDDDRFIAVLQAAAKAFGWTTSKAAGHGYGIAGGFEKGGHVGTCAEVLVTDKEVKVLRVTQAFECGAIVNPHHLENQATGSIIMGLGGALFEAVLFADGKIQNAGLSAYRVPRFTDVPKIEVILVDRKDLPSAGAGEACIVGVAPAIRNAILDAAGTALNTLPMLPNQDLG
jgi:isoquinoline 1-oxidoreductase